MQHPDESYLRDVLNAARLIRQFIEGIDLESFRADQMRSSAVIRQLEIMGEATKQLSLALRQANPDVRWRTIAGMRDVLIHGYRGVDLVEVYKAATMSIPDLIPRFERTWQKSKTKQGRSDDA
ncbi:MAG TPA: DUF86 domain-containing protein [Longimicrobium sp.]|jgi:uncharacterized protein with HEPN domain|uniref:HepT-like ribonuclease domain-containing protein n=1 Tax=Longimicrobium sp. TaxID=2029185 RepID=UPI002EDB9BD7